MEGTIRDPDTSSVVVGVDGSQSARDAAQWASAEAARRGRPLHLVHAVDTNGRAFHLSAASVEQVRRAGSELLEETAAAITAEHPELHLTTEFSRRDPVTALHRAAGLHSTIVVGNRGLGGFNSLMLGSVSLRTAAGARTPLIVVRGVEDGAEAGVVLAAVRDELDLGCARYAAREAELRKASLRLLHVSNALQSVGNVVSMLDNIEEIADGYVERLKAIAEEIRGEYPGLTVHADAEKSISVAGVLVEASHHADLLVMGGRRSPGYIGPSLGHITHSLVHHAHCPVLLFPRHGQELRRKS
ncbi:universal stress protein [Streptomyces sp. NPDC055059]|jgi:nucleotide-binding universal stress UspA family protein|uniref:universal stress protein n=1 Tax=Streptomyces sp. NPDC127172 TaxID=3345382 RepID=UPI003633A5E9